MSGGLDGSGEPTDRVATSGFERPGLLTEWLPLAAWFVLIFLWMILNPAVSPAVAALTLAVLFAWGTPFLVCLRSVTGKAGYAEVLAAFAIGLSVLGCASYAWRAFGLAAASFDWITAGLFAASCLMLVLVTYKRAPAGRPNAISWRDNAPWLAAAVVILAMPISYVLVMGWLSGWGTYPKTILSVDTAFDLAALRALLTSPLVPPEILTYSGIRLSYHYGSLEAAAAITRLTGIPAHVSLYYLVLPFWGMAPSAGAWLLLRRVCSDRRVLVLCALIVAPAMFSFVDLLNPRPVVVELIGRWLIHGDFGSPPFVRIGPTHATAASARALAAIVVALLAYWDRRWARILSAAVVGLIANLNIFWFGSIGLLYGIFVLCISWRERSLWSLAYPAAAFVLGVILVLGSGDSTIPIHFAFEPFANKYSINSAISLFAKAWPLMLIAVACCFIPKYKEYTGLVAAYAIYLVLAIAVVLLVGFHYGSRPQTTDDWWQWLYSVPLTLAMLAAVGASRISPRPRWIVLIVAAAVLFVSPLQSLRYPVVAIQTLANPAGRKDGSFDTATLYEALSKIPVQGSLVMTNDITAPGLKKPALSHPALAALLGHSVYLTSESISWDFQPDVATRFNDLKMLQAPSWPEGADTIVSARGWTHLLIHKSYPHAAFIPYRKIFENDDYAVYDLSSSTR